MIEISNERWQELIEQMSPKERARLDADQAVASRLFLQRMERTGKPDMIAEVVSGLSPEQIASALKPEEREALRKLLDEQKV